MALQQFGMVGLGVMGSNLALNFESKGFSVAGYDRDGAFIDGFMEGPAKGKDIRCYKTIANFCKNLERPRRIMIMVKAGAPVDWVIEQLLPHLEKGDILIDGGNSHFEETRRRTESLEAEGFRFFGCGVSGGEEGARLGPALMPGGSKPGWAKIQPMFEAISAKLKDGTPCCAYMGPDGAGHYVKMVHNGIEYGDMQLICEAYFLMSEVLGMKPKAQSKVFASWNEGDLDSYLIDITAKILARKDDKTGNPLVDMILDTAGQKGTGKWTSVSALDLGVPAPSIAEAVFARCVSAIKDERVAASRKLPGPKGKIKGLKKQQFIADLEQALYASKICSYAQGFQLLRYASAEYKWDLDYPAIASTWREGCIIRARFLDRIRKAYTQKPETVNLLLVPYFKKSIINAQESWRRVISTAVQAGVPAPAMSSALAYYDSYRSARLPANLLQAQRDFFGAHTYERTDGKRGEFFHTQWTE